ncbi:alpha-amylase [bacterium]|nr:alpha-amylase [candidate division CSSED10-310 bacterium]
MPDTNDSDSRNPLTLFFHIGFALLLSAILPNPSLAKNSWFESSVFYEIFVKSFYDADRDGTGDLQGIIEKLDYINATSPEKSAGLGANAVWLMPVFDSPSYHGYDVRDYRKIRPSYGSLADFQNLIKACHARGMHIILDYPLNHASIDHLWFQQALKDAHSSKRKMFIFRRNRPARWRQPWDPLSGPESVWHPAGSQYYYGVFYSGMPDLNFKNPEVSRIMIDTAKYWIGMGVDGFRLDGVRYLIETGAGSGQADTPMTLEWLRKFNRELKAVNPDICLIGEAWTEMRNIVPYITEPNAVDACFDFDLAEAIIQAVTDNNYHHVKACLDMRSEMYPADFSDAIFLSNHDQTRIASRLKLEYQQRLAAVLLMTLPGTPFVYYGEEIGMEGTKPDPNIRRNFCWNSSVAAQCNDRCLTEQQNDPESLWNHYCKLIHFRKILPELSTMSISWFDSGSKHIAIYKRGSEQNNVVVVANFGIRPELPGIPVDIWTERRGFLVDLFSSRRWEFETMDETEGRYILDPLLPGNIYLLKQEYVGKPEPKGTP